MFARRPRSTHRVFAALLATLLLAYAVLPAAPAHAAGTTYYVDSVNGQDSYSGLLATQAWRSFANLNSRTYGAGDRISFARGSTWSGAILHIQGAGTSADPIRLQVHGSGAAPVLKNPGGLTVLEISADRVVVDGLAFRDTTTFSTFGDTEYRRSGALLINPGADYVTVQNSDFGAVGLGVKSYGLNTLITNNTFHDLIIAYTDSTQSYGAIGVSINNANAEIAYNTFTNCRSTNSPYGADGGAIEIEGYDYAKNNISIHHNRSTDSQGFLEVTETTSSNVTLAHNISDDYQQFIAWDTTTTPANYKVEHNTVIRTRTQNATALFAVFYYREEGPTPSNTWMSFRNNIFYTPAAAVLNGSYSYKYHNYPHDHNLFFGGSSPLGYALGPGDLIADPQFVNFSTRDLRLKLTSPAVNNGVNLSYSSDFANSSRLVGPVPDMGAYEYQSYSAGGANLLADPGFETQTSITSGSSPWYAEGGASYGVDVNQGKARSGQDNAWIATGSGTGWGAIKQTISVAANTNYRLTVWVRNSANFDSAYFGVKTTGGAVLNEVRHGAAGSYTAYTITFNSSSNTSVVVHTGYFGPGSSSWQQIDDWSLSAL